MLVRSMVQGRHLSDQKFVDVTLLTDVELSVSRMCEMFQKIPFLSLNRTVCENVSEDQFGVLPFVHLHCVKLVRRGKSLALNLC